MSAECAGIVWAGKRMQDMQSYKPVRAGLLAFPAVPVLIAELVLDVPNLADHTAFCSWLTCHSHATPMQAMEFWT